MATEPTSIPPPDTRPTQPIPLTVNGHVEAGIIGTIVHSLRNQPLVLAMLVMNLAIVWTFVWTSGRRAELWQQELKLFADVCRGTREQAD